MNRLFPTMLALAATIPSVVVLAEPTGREVFDRMLGHLENSKKLELVAKLEQQVSSAQMNMSQSAAVVHDVAIDRSGKLAIRRNAQQTGDSPILSADLISDGQTLTTLLHPSNRYSTQPAPKALTELDSPILKNDPAAMAVACLLNPAALRSALDGVEPTYVGSEQLEGETVDHIRIVVPADQMKTATAEEEAIDLPMDIYVSAGDQPWVRKIVPDMGVVLSAMREQGAQFPADDFRVELSLSMNQWATPAGFGADVFAFNAPQGATKVDDVFANTGTTSAGQDAPESLVGKPAPDFALPDLDGNEVKLSELKGKLVVIDFWATWCPPCVEGLPKVAAATEKFVDQGAVFYALNQQETVEEVRTFLNEQKFDIDVLMDEGGAAGAYLVRGIPQTVVIDKEGVVRAVHVGFGPGSEKRLERDIQKALQAKH